MYKASLIIGPAYSGKTSIAHKLCASIPKGDKRLIYFFPQVGQGDERSSLDWLEPNFATQGNEGSENHNMYESPKKRQELYSHDAEGFITLVRHNLGTIALIIDGLNLWWAQLYLRNLGKYAPEHAYLTALKEAQELLTALSEFQGETLVLVTQETGLGLPPRAASERFFRQGMGLWAQCLSGFCQETLWVVAGKIMGQAQSG